MLNYPADMLYETKSVNLCRLFVSHVQASISAPLANPTTFAGLDAIEK